MSDPQRPLNTFHAFCSLLLPGLGQLLQKRIGTALGFFVLFILTGFLPVLIVSHLFMDRFSQETHGVSMLHVLVFVGICFPMMFALSRWCSKRGKSKFFHGVPAKSQAIIEVLSVF